MKISRPIKISRRGFLATGVAGSVASLLPLTEIAADAKYTRMLSSWIDSRRIGVLHYIQVHCSERFDLVSAAVMVDVLTPELVLEKVSALGDSEFATAPENVLASMYYTSGARATLVSTAPRVASFGTIRGSDGSIELYDDRVVLVDRDGTELRSFEAAPEPSGEATDAYTMILQALREGKTIYPEK